MMNVWARVFNLARRRGGARANGAGTIFRVPYRLGTAHPIDLQVINPFILDRGGKRLQNNLQSNKKIK